MSLPRYPEYKESGVEWLGEVPGHWGTARLRWLSTRYSGGTPDKLNLDYWTEGSIPWVNSGAVNQSLVTEPSAYITEAAFENSSAKWIPTGALVMALAGQGKTKGMVAQLAIPTTCNQSMAAIIPNQELAARFLFWWLNSNYQNIRNMAGGDLRDGLNLELLGNMPCPVAPFPEQQAIATFLDNETGKIDALIAEQQRLVGLLAEKRQAVISHAVTKGLNPDAPMKDSGIEWLGEVPAHWGVCAVRRVIERIEQGWSPECESRPAEPEEWGVLKAGCVNRGFFVEEENKALPKNLEPMPEYEVHKGDVLMSRASGSPDLVGSVAFIEMTRTRLMLSDKIFRVRLNDRYTPRFFAALFNSSLLRAQIVQSISGAEGLANNLPQSSMKRFFITLPPLEEQTAITAFLDSETAKFDTLTAEANRAITLLQERRSALISAAVTGKIDVRGLAPA